MRQIVQPVLCVKGCYLLLKADIHHPQRNNCGYSSSVHVNELTLNNCDGLGNNIVERDPKVNQFGPPTSPLRLKC